MTPCWVRGAETVDDLKVIHLWNAMLCLLKKVEHADARMQARMRVQLTGICESRCPNVRAASA